jgi:hypothetical protein
MHKYSNQFWSCLILMLTIYSPPFTNSWKYLKLQQ